MYHRDILLSLSTNVVIVSLQTLRLQFGHLLHQTILALLQLSLLLLHILDVVAQRPDLGLVLWEGGTVNTQPWANVLLNPRSHLQSRFLHF